MRCALLLSKDEDAGLAVQRAKERGYPGRLVVEGVDGPMFDALRFAGVPIFLSVDSELRIRAVGRSLRAVLSE